MPGSRRTAVRRRRAPGRLFYSLLALSALAIVWSLAYWNLLKVG